MDNIAGVCDINGLVYGMMPHPERTNCQEIKEMLLFIVRDRKERLAEQRAKFEYEVKNLMNSEHFL